MGRAPPPPPALMERPACVPSVCLTLIAALASSKTKRNNGAPGEGSGLNAHPASGRHAPTTTLDEHRRTRRRQRRRRQAQNMHEVPVLGANGGAKEPHNSWISTHRPTNLGSKFTTCLATLTECSPSSATFGKPWLNPGRMWLKSSRFRSNPHATSTKDGRHRIKFGRNRATIGRNRGKFGRDRTELGQNWPLVTRIGPNWGRRRPKSAGV